MSDIQQRTISVPAEHAAFIDAKVASGDYASSSDVVAAGLDALREREEGVETWLREQVAPTYDAMMTDPGQGIPLRRAFDEILGRQPDGTKKSG